MSTPLIKCKNVSFEYDGNVVLENINFEICEGDYLCIAGSNGSGKSTLIKGLLKLKKPFKGEIAFSDGLSLRDISYLAQKTDAQKDFPASVWEAVSCGALNKKGFNFFFSKTDKQNIENALKRLDVFDLKSKCFRELSGGQQQRVLIARAICSLKKLLILDELSSGLDPNALNNSYSLLKKLNKENGITIVAVSHDVKNCAKAADKILHLANKQLFFGNAQEYLKSDIGKSWTENANV
ncbi:MAG: metal ABC transporter ATP-binding protein [Endomicrobium sp.]|jgi:zinc transport system ATP-binding protein|nr:metal ABC transporter ATP-binding protein [Endomicrobium sp.]